MSDKVKETNGLSLDDLNETIALNSDDAEAYINRAKYYYKQGNHELTLSDFIKAIKLNPDNSVAYIAITDHYYDQGCYDLALAFLTKLIELNSDSINVCEYYKDRGNSYAQQGHNELALSDYNQAIKLNSDYAAAYCDRGGFYSREKEYDLAVADLNKLVKLDPSNASSYSERGDCYYKQKLFLLAIPDYNRAIALSSETAILYSKKGTCYRDQKIYLLAIADYTKAIELSPDNDNYYNLRAICNDQMKNYKAAIVDFTKAIELNPDNDVLYGNRASCYENKNNIDLAIADYIKADDLVEHLKDYENYHQYGNPDAGKYFYYMHKWQELESRKSYQPEQEKRIALLNKITKDIESEPDSELLYHKRAEVHKQLNDDESALTDYTKAIELNAEFSESYHERGVVYFEQENIKSALDDFNNAIKLNSAYSESYLRRGACYAEQENDDLAFIDFTKTIELNPKSYLAYHNLATYYYKKDDYILCLDCMDKAIEFSDSLETKKDYCFFAKSVACRIKKYTNAKAYIEQIFENVDSKEKQHKDIYLQDIDKEERLEQEIKEKEALNQSLLVKEKELEDMMSMFAHKFRSPLDAIIYNTNHENNPKLYIEAAQTMRGLLDIFSIISTDDTVLTKKIIEDSSGNRTLEDLLSNSFNMILLHFLSASGAEKIRQHYIHYAKTHDLCANDVTPKQWNQEYFELEQSLQTTWEQEYSALLMQSAALADRLAWIEAHFFKIDVQGFEDSSIRFQQYGTTESFLTIILNEILVNSFKYYASDTDEVVTLHWNSQSDYQELSCANPCTKISRRSKGSGNGHTFLASIANKTACVFDKPALQDQFKVSFKIPNQLLIAN